MSGVEREIRRARAIAIFRGDFPWAEVERTTELLLDHGFNIVEYTLTSPHALDTISRLKTRFAPRVSVGAGTVVSPSDVSMAREAGADFLVSPGWSPAVSDAARAQDSLLLPGVFTPTEVDAARRESWYILKLFPASTGGPNHVRALRGPFPDVDFVPTGGVTATNVTAFLRAGAVAVGIGSSLFKPGVATADLRTQLGAFRALLDETGRA